MGLFQFCLPVFLGQVLTTPKTKNKKSIPFNQVCNKLPLLWPVQQSGAAVKHNDIIVTLGLLSKQQVAYTPVSHVSLGRTNRAQPSQPILKNCLCMKIKFYQLPCIEENIYTIACMYLKEHRPRKVRRGGKILMLYVHLLRYLDFNCTF